MKLAVPRFAILSKKHFLQSIIPSLYLQLRTRIKTSLRQAEYCSFTTDLWTAKYQNHSYISLTCHFIDQEWELHSYCLEIRELPIDHTTEKAAAELSEKYNPKNLKRIYKLLCGMLR